MQNPLPALQSLFSAWRDATPNPKQVKPIVIQFPINNVCNSGCQMCDIWKQKKGEEISPTQIRKTFSDPLFSNVSSIGFNGGEPTLRKDFKELVEAAIESLPRLKGVSLITNAIIVSRVKNCIDDLAEVCTRNRVKLDVMISVDGIGDVHDRVRGKAGNFSSASSLVDYILAHPGVYSSRIGCTLIRENIFDAENVLAWAKDKGIYARFRSGVPHQRLYSQDKIIPFAFTDEERFHFCNFLDGLRVSYEKNAARKDFYLSLRNQIAYNASRSAGCAWKNKGVTLLSDGGLAYCAVNSPTLGNVHLANPQELYWANQQVLRDINDHKCASCRHDYEGLSSKKVILHGVAHKLFEYAPSTKVLARNVIRVKRRIQASIPSVDVEVALASKNPTRTMLIVGWYGTETLGDKAILGGLIGVIRSEMKDIRIDIASLEPYVSLETKRQMPELSDCQIVSLGEAEQRLKNGNYSEFVFGGGPLMSSIFELQILVRLAKLAKRSGAIVYVAGCGVGPIGDASGNNAIRDLLMTANKVLLRDMGSVNVAKSLGVTRPLSYSIDPAFLWIANNRSEKRDRDDKILIALRDWPIHEYARGVKNAMDIKLKFDAQVVEFVKAIQKFAPEYKIQAFCMHRLAVGGDDLLYYQRVLKDFPDIVSSIPPRHRSPEEDLREFETSAGVLAMRFHSVVFGLASGTPTLAVDYTRGGKIAAVLKDNGFDSPTSIDFFDGVSAAKQLIDKIQRNNQSTVDISAASRAYGDLFSTEAAT